MTTYDKHGRMTSKFTPPTENGRPITHTEYIRKKALAMLAVRGEADTLAWLQKYRENGPTDSAVFMAAMAGAVDAVKAASRGEGPVSTSPLPKRAQNEEKP